MTHASYWRANARAGEVGYLLGDNMKGDSRDPLDPMRMREIWESHQQLHAASCYVYGFGAAELWTLAQERRFLLGFLRVEFPQYRGCDLMSMWVSHLEATVGRGRRSRSGIHLLVSSHNVFGERIRAPHAKVDKYRVREWVELHDRRHDLRCPNLVNYEKRKEQFLADSNSKKGLRIPKTIEELEASVEKGMKQKVESELRVEARRASRSRSKCGYSAKCLTVEQAIGELRRSGEYRPTQYANHIAAKNSGLRVGAKRMGIICREYSSGVRTIKPVDFLSESDLQAMRDELNKIVLESPFFESHRERGFEHE